MTLAILLASGLALKGFYHLQKLFFYYAKGKIFTTEANGQIKNFGVTICLWPFCKTLCILLTNIAVYLTYETPIRMTNTPPDKSVSIITPLILFPLISHAITWDDLWARPDQQGARALQPEQSVREGVHARRARTHPRPGARARRDGDDRRLPRHRLRR